MSNPPNNNAGHGHAKTGKTTHDDHGHKHGGDHHDDHHHGPSLEDLLKNPAELARADMALFGYRKYPRLKDPAHPTPVALEKFEARLSALNKKFSADKKKIDEQIAALTKQRLDPNAELIKKRDSLEARKKEVARGILADLIATNHWRELTPAETSARAEFLAGERRETAKVEQKIVEEAATQKLAVAYEEFSRLTSPSKLIELLRAAGVKDDRIVHKVLAQMKLLRLEAFSPKVRKERGSAKALTPKFFDLEPREAEVFDDIVNHYQAIGLASEVTGQPTSIEGLPATEIEKVAKSKYAKDLASFKAFILRHTTDPTGEFASAVETIKKTLDKATTNEGLTPREIDHRNKIKIYLTRNGVESKEFLSALPNKQEQKTFERAEGLFNLLDNEEDFNHVFSIFLQTDDAFRRAKDEELGLADHQKAIAEIQANFKKIEDYADANLPTETCIALKNSLAKIRARAFNPEDEHGVAQANRVIEEKTAKKEVLSGPDAQVLTKLVDHFKHKKLSEIALAAYSGSAEFLYRVSREHIKETLFLADRPPLSQSDLAPSTSAFHDLGAFTYLKDINTCKAIVELLREEGVDPVEFANAMPKASDLAVAARIKDALKDHKKDESDLLLEDFAQWRLVRTKNSSGERSLRNTLKKLSASAKTKGIADKIEALLLVLAKYDEEQAKNPIPEQTEQTVPALESRGKWYLVGDQVAPFFTDISEIDTAKFTRTQVSVGEISGKIEKLTVRPATPNNINRIFLRTPEGTTASFIDFRLDHERSPYKQKLYLEEIVSSPDQPAEFVSYLNQNSLPLLKGIKTASPEQLKVWIKNLADRAHVISPLVVERLNNFPPDEIRDFLEKIALNNISWRLLGQAGKLTLDKITRLRANERTGALSGAFAIEGIVYPVIHDKILYEFNGHKVLGFDCQDFNTVRGFITLEENGIAKIHRFENGVLFRLPLTDLRFAEEPETIPDTAKVTDPNDKATWFDRSDTASQTFYGAETKPATDSPAAFEMPTPKAVRFVDPNEVSDDTGLWFDFDGQLHGQLTLDSKQYLVNSGEVREISKPEDVGELEFLKLYHQAVETILAGGRSYLPEGLITLEAILNAAPGRPPANWLPLWQKLAGVDTGDTLGELVLARMIKDSLLEEVKSTSWFRKGPRTFAVMGKGKDWKTRLEEIERQNQVRESESYETLTALEENKILSAYLCPTGENSATTGSDSPNQTYQDFQRFLVTSKNSEKFKTIEGMQEQLANIATLFGIDSLTPEKLPNLSEATRLRLWLKLLSGLEKEVRLTPPRVAPVVSADSALPQRRPARSPELVPPPEDADRALEQQIIQDYLGKDPGVKTYLKNIYAEKINGVKLFSPELILDYLNTIRDAYKIDSLHPDRLNKVSAFKRIKIWAEIVARAIDAPEIDPTREAQIVEDYTNPDTISPSDRETPLSVYHRMMFEAGFNYICSLEGMSLYVDNIRHYFHIDSLDPNKNPDLDQATQIRIWLKIVEIISESPLIQQLEMSLTSKTDSATMGTAVTQNSLEVVPAIPPHETPAALNTAEPETREIDPNDDFVINVIKPEFEAEPPHPAEATPVVQPEPTLNLDDAFAEFESPTSPKPAETPTAEATQPATTEPSEAAALTPEPEVKTPVVEPVLETPRPLVDRKAKVQSLLDQLNQIDTDETEAAIANGDFEPLKVESVIAPAPEKPQISPRNNKVDQLLTALSEEDEPDEPSDEPSAPAAPSEPPPKLPSTPSERPPSINPPETYFAEVSKVANTGPLTALVPPEEPPKPPKKPITPESGPAAELTRSEAFVRTQLKKFLESFDASDPSFARTDRLANFLIASGINLTQENLTSPPWFDLVNQEIERRKKEYLDEFTLEDLQKRLPTEVQLEERRPEATKRALDSLDKERQYNEFLAEIKASGELGRAFLNSKRRLKKEGNKTFSNLLDDAAQKLKELDPAAIAEKKRTKKGSPRLSIVQLDKEKPLTHSLLIRRFNAAFATVTEAWREFKKTGGKI